MYFYGIIIREKRDIDGKVRAFSFHLYDTIQVEVRRVIAMCEEVKKYKQEHNDNFDNYFNLKEIDNDAQNLLDMFYQNSDYHLRSTKATPIIEIAKLMGFRIFTAKFKDRTLSGTIGISDELKKKYGGTKVIILNNQDTDKHILFTLAHEIAHYIFDYKKEAVGYSNTYRTDEALTDSERRANRFAAAFLMPKKKFISVFKQHQDIPYLSEYFNVPETAVELRIQELELAYDR